MDTDEKLKEIMEAITRSKNTVYGLQYPRRTGLITAHQLRYLRKSLSKAYWATNGLLDKERRCSSSCPTCRNHTTVPGFDWDIEICEAKEQRRSTDACKSWIGK